MISLAQAEPAREFGKGEWQMSGFSEDLKQARAGDAEALCRLLETQGRSLSWQLRGHMNPALRQRYDTTDLRQSVILEVLKSLAGVEDRGEEAFRGWLAIKARNKVRAKFRRLLGPTGTLREQAWSSAPPHVEDPNSRPLDEALRNEDGENVRSALRSLEPRYREVVRLRVEEGLSHAEVATWMDLPSPDAARKLCARALVQLRLRLKTVLNPP
jgi:RNA polymerase sigma factor (sigma-70 family)